MQFRIYLFVLVLAVQSSASKADSLPTRPAHRVSASAQYGFILAHTRKLDYLSRAHITGMELAWEKQTDRSKAWHALYNFPRWGFSYMRIDLGNPQQTGNSHIALANLQLPLIKNNFANLNFRLSSGLAYIDHPFDRIENHKNVAIGSHINGAVDFRFSSEIKIAKSMSFSAALGITHFSNAAYKTPNLGLNMPTARAGLTWAAGSVSPAKLNDPAPFKKANERAFTLAAGPKEISPAGGKKYAAYNASFTYGRKVNQKSIWGLGADFSYDTSIHDQLLQDSLTDITKSMNIRTGVHLSHELVISKLTVLTQMGAYLYSEVKSQGPVYHKMGMRYNVSEKLFASLILKTHYANADNLELGVGKRF